MSIPSGDDPEFGDPAATKKQTPRRRYTLADFLLLLALMVILFALLLPFVYRATAHLAARRAHCQNNLRRIAMALRAYALEHGGLPPAYTTDADGRPLHSWRTLLLPYLDAEALYRTIDLSKPWNDPANARALNTEMRVYHCIDLDPGRPNRTVYRASVGPRAFLLPTEPRPLATITDDPRTTLALIEVDEPNAVPWMAPEDADEAMILSFGPGSKLVHPGGRFMTTVDLSVIFTSLEVPPEARRALITVDGGEAVSRDLFIR
jgi:hypothetical protein